MAKRNKRRASGLSEQQIQVMETAKSLVEDDDDLNVDASELNAELYNAVNNADNWIKLKGMDPDDAAMLLYEGIKAEVTENGEEDLEESKKPSSVPASDREVTTKDNKPPEEEEEDKRSDTEKEHNEWQGTYREEVSKVIGFKPFHKDISEAMREAKEVGAEIASATKEMAGNITTRAAVVAASIAFFNMTSINEAPEELDKDAILRMLQSDLFTEKGQPKTGEIRKSIKAAMFPVTQMTPEQVKETETVLSSSHAKNALSDALKYAYLIIGNPHRALMGHAARPASIQIARFKSWRSPAMDENDPDYGKGYDAVGMALNEMEPVFIDSNGREQKQKDDAIYQVTPSVLKAQYAKFWEGKKLDRFGKVPKVKRQPGGNVNARQDGASITRGDVTIEDVSPVEIIAMLPTLSSAFKDERLPDNATSPYTFKRVAEMADNALSGTDCTKLCRRVLSEYDSDDTTNDMIAMFNAIVDLWETVYALIGDVTGHVEQKTKGDKKAA